jgi:hypothetical protein
MLGRRWAAVGALSCVFVFARRGVRAETPSSMKADIPPPVVEANTLLLETEDLLAPAIDPNVGATDAELSAEPEPGPLVMAKYHPKACSAAAVRMPHGGVRVVTASHCAAEDLAIFDGRHWQKPRATAKASDGSDLAVLDFRGAAWPGLVPRPAASVPLGERLCAWRVSRGPRGLQRESICARLIERKEGGGGRPILVMSHPYPSGTSGSPLVDAQGRAVGVVVASDGVSGFAEPIEAVFSIGRLPSANVSGTGARVPAVRR